MIANLFMQFAEIADTIIHNKKTNGEPFKLEYKVNFRQAASILKLKMLDLLRKPKIGRIINLLIERMCEHLSAVRPGRSFNRRFPSCKHPLSYRLVFVPAELS